MSAFDHYAFVYNDSGEFLDHIVGFIEEGVNAGGAIMVAVDRDKIAMIEQRLGAASAKVDFRDMREVGRNPGAIISAWQDFAQANAGRAMWGVGEPAWPGRSAAEFEECRHHECLLNAAFSETPNFRLVCPYDGSRLEPSVLERVGDSHPTVAGADHQHSSESYLKPDELDALLHEPLAPPPNAASSLTFDLASLVAVRRLIRELAAEAQLDEDGTHEIVTAVNELAENSVRHGSGSGRLQAWFEEDRLVAEVTDSGRISNPLAGRRRPSKLSSGGYGLWLTHQVCDLVQLRSTDEGTTVRVHMCVPVTA